MSNAVYPTLPGLMWPFRRTPVWKTTIATTPSGREWRSTAMASPRYRYGLQYEFLRTEAAYAEFQSLFGFFNSRSGSFDSFLLDDPSDNTAAGAQFGVGNGATTSFQLLRAIGGYAEPVAAVRGTPSVFVGGAHANLLSGGDFAVDSNADGLANGFITATNGSVSGVAFSSTGGPWPNVQRVAASSLGGTSGDSAGFRLEDFIPVVAGGSYTLAADIYSNVCSHRLLLAFYTASGGSLGAVHDSWLGNGISYARRAISAVAPAGAARAYVYVDMHSGTGASPDMRVDNLTLTPTATDPGFLAASYQVSQAGIVTFSAAPAGAAALTWSGNYYQRVRFDADELTFEQFLQQFWKTGEVRFITVKP